MTRAAIAGLAVTGFLSWLLFLMIHAPAALLPTALPSASPLVMDDIRGTLWRGSARLSTSRAGVGTLRWTLSGAAMLRGVMDLRIVVQGPDLGLRARVRHGYISDRTELLGMDADIALAALAAMTGIERLFDANVAARNVDLLARDGIVQSVAGDVQLDAVTLLHPRRQLIGSYGIGLAADGEWVQARVTDAQGPLDVEGEAAFTVTGQWRLDLLMSARGGDEDLARGLAFVGTPDAAGRYRLRLSGEL